jgi:hypothetical protein
MVFLYTFDAPLPLVVGAGVREAGMKWKIVAPLGAGVAALVGLGAALRTDAGARAATTGAAMMAGGKKKICPSCTKPSPRPDAS